MCLSLCGVCAEYVRSMEPACEACNIALPLGVGNAISQQSQTHISRHSWAVVTRVIQPLELYLLSAHICALGHYAHNHTKAHSCVTNLVLQPLAIKLAFWG